MSLLSELINELEGTNWKEDKAVIKAYIALATKIKEKSIELSNDIEKMAFTPHYIQGFQAGLDVLQKELTEGVE